MARDTDKVNGWLGRQFVIPVWWVVAALVVLPLLVFFYVAGPGNADENVALSRNEVVQDRSGGRTWYGTMVNTSSYFPAQKSHAKSLTVRGRRRDALHGRPFSSRQDI